MAASCIQARQARGGGSAAAGSTEVRALAPGSSRAAVAATIGFVLPLNGRIAATTGGAHSGVQQPTFSSSVAPISARAPDMEQSVECIVDARDGARGKESATSRKMRKRSTAARVVLPHGTVNAGAAAPVLKHVGQEAQRLRPAAWNTHPHDLRRNVSTYCYFGRAAGGLSCSARAYRPELQTFRRTRC